MTSHIGAEQGPYMAKRPAVPKQKWTPEEEVALRGGVSKYGTGKWRLIQKDETFGPVLANRSNVDLKDKWRNLTMDSFSMRSKKPKPGKRGGQAGAGQGEEGDEDGAHEDGAAEPEEPCPKRRRRRKKKPERAADATDYPHAPAAALQPLQDALGPAPGPGPGAAHQAAAVQPKLEAYATAAPLGAAWLYGQPGPAAGGAGALLRPVGQHPALVEAAEWGGHGTGAEPGALATSLGGPGPEALRVLGAAQAGSLLRGHGALGRGFLAQGLPMPQPVAFPQHCAPEAEPADGCVPGMAAKRRIMRKPARPAELHRAVEVGDGEQESGRWPEDEGDEAQGGSVGGGAGGRGHPWPRRRRERATERCDRHGPIPDDMVVAALISLQDPMGSQLDDIHVWIEENYGAGAASRKMVKRTLARMVEAGRLDVVPGAVRAYRLGGVMCRMSQEAVFGWRARCHEDDQTAAQAAKAAAAAVAEAEEAAALATQLMAVAARVEKEAQAQAAAAAGGQLPTP